MADDPGPTAEDIFAEPLATRARLAGDRHRPIYHFLPPTNWMNDPNGLIHWRGRYHMFYQCNPRGAFWDTMHWGHAVSEDLVHWRDLPIALAPGPGGADADGCFSGCAVDDNGTPTIVYTGVNGLRHLPCLAVGDADLLTLRKYPQNPVISAPPDDLPITDLRDHSVWREGDTWCQIVGAGIRGVGGVSLLYTSPDLRAWTYQHPLCVGDLHQREPVWTGRVWECPSFLRFLNGHALIVSAWDGDTLHSIAMTGAYRERRFTPDVTYKLDFGDTFFYAPQAMREESGRWLLWGWMQEGRSRAAQIAAGWSGVMSLPRVVTLRDDGLLGQEPAPELRMLRGERTLLERRAVAPGQRGVLGGLRGDTLEIIAEIAAGGAGRAGLRLRAAPDGSEETLLGYDWRSGTLFLDRTRASADPEAAGDIRQGPLALEDGEPLRLHIFLDRSAIEVFANGRAAISGRVYPAGEASLGVDAFAEGGAAEVALEAWTMRGIWPS